MADPLDAQIISKLEAIERRLSRIEDRLPVDRSPAEPSSPPAVEPVRASAPAPVAPTPQVAQEPTSDPTPASTPPPAVRPIPTVPKMNDVGAPPQRRTKEEPSFERLLGESILPKLGAVAIVTGFVTLTTLAIRQGWIGPTAQFGGSVLLSLVFWVLGLRNRGPLSSLLAGVGTAGFYLSFTGGHVTWRLYDSTIMFALFLTVAAVNLAMGWGRQSRDYAVFGVIGGFLAAFSLGSETRVLSPLGCMLAVHLTALTLTHRHGWPWVGALSSFLGGVIGLITVQRVDLTAVGNPQTLSALLMVNLGTWSMVYVLSQLREENWSPIDIVTIALGLAASVAAVNVLTTGGLNALALGIGHLAIAARVGWRVPIAPFLAAVSITIVAPFALPSNMVGGVLALLAAAISAYIGTQKRFQFLPYAWLQTLFALAVLATTPWSSTTPPWFFAAFLLASGSLVCAASLAPDDRDGMTEGGIYGACIVLWIAASMSGARYDAMQSAGEWKAGLSTAWGVLGLLLLPVGFLFKRPEVRLSGFAILGLTTLRVATVDLAVLDTGVRIVLCILMGVGMLALSSLLYQRKKVEPRSEADSPTGS